VKIVHLAASANGMPWLIAILREQRRRGHDARAAIQGRDGTVAKILDAESIPYDVLDMSMPGSSAITGIARRILGIARYLRRARPDVVMYHLYPSIVMGRIGGWLADVPLRFSMIPGTLYLEAPILGDAEAGTAWADTRVVATCEKTRDLYIERGVRPEKLEVIYYGLDPEAFDPARASRTKFRRELGIDDDTPLVGLVAYFYPPMTNAHFTPPHLLGRGVKGHETLFRAIPRVLSEFPNAKFVLVGSGQGADGDRYEQSLRALARESGIDHAVIFAGERDDVPDVLASFDIALQCSLCENLGGSIEALMMGKPLIATRVGGLVDSVRDEETGLLVPPDDDTALADAIARLLRDRALAARLGANGRRFMLDRFTLTRAVDDLDALYQRCGSSRGYRLFVSILRLPLIPLRVASLVIRLQAARLRRLALAIIR
jgi:glycosyltransferase involved in cell wall biosynthesis